MIIIGAGMAGLLAANMLRRHKPVIFEASKSLPNNHDALLRFRTDAVSRVTGIPFKKVSVLKAIMFEDKLRTTPDLRLSNMYAEKVTGKYSSRSILDLRPVERYIAPPDFIKQMAGSCAIDYEKKVTTLDSTSDIVPVISTMPMETLMKLAGWKDIPEFPSREITTFTAILPEGCVDLYQTIYYPDRATPVYRASMTGNKLNIECMGDGAEYAEEDDEIQLHKMVLEDFGIFHISPEDWCSKTQRLGKISPIAEAVRKEFILAMTDLHRIYSVGRFATWRQILLDDVVQDVQRVESMIVDRDNYRRALKGAGL